MNNGKTRLASINVICENTGKETTILAEKLEWSARSEECEMCGSHGHATVEFKCPECGKQHEIEVYSF